MNIKIPCGAAADLKELEYIAALHQVGEYETKKNRKDNENDENDENDENNTNNQAFRKSGSINASDVAIFLSSRYGIEISPKEARSEILNGLGGGEDNDEDIDLVELVAILLIPHLVKLVSTENKNNSSPATTDILDDVVNMILAESNRKPPVNIIDKALLKQIFKSYGETVLAKNDNLIQDMIEAAGGAGNPLDKDSFMRALTADILEYKPEDEGEETTNYHDILDDAGVETNAPKFAKNSIHNEIDFNSETYQSLFVSVVLWIFYTLSFYSSANEQLNGLIRVCVSDNRGQRRQLSHESTYAPASAPWGDYGIQTNYTSLQFEISDYPCIVGSRIFSWIAKSLILGIFGTLFIVMGSTGNTPQKSSRIMLFLSILVIAVYAFVPLIFWYSYYEVAMEFKVLDLCNMLIGVSLIVIQITRILNKQIFHLNGNTVREGSIKQAAAHKISLMVDNACEIHKKGNTESKSKPSSQGLFNFNKYGEDTENINGYWCVWGDVLSGRAKTVRGILLPSRLIAGNISMVFVILFCIVSCINVIIDYQEGYAEEVKKGIYVLACIGFIAASIVTYSYIPSTVITTLQLRSGVIPSLDANSFQKYRIAQDSSSILLGSMLFGTFFTFFFVGGFFAIIAFFATFEGTQKPFLLGVSNIIGSLIAGILFLIVRVCFRRQYFKAFYRKNPNKANLMTVVIECINIGLAYGKLFIRAFSLALTSLMYIGRIDKPFLAEGVDAHQIEIDPFPTMFRRFLLLQEAHRHPYLEVIGRIYLMKLRPGVSFVSKAGSCWRLLFVQALMPWIRKYRILAKPALHESIRDICDSSYNSFDVGSSSRSMIRSGMSVREVEMQYQEEIERLKMIIKSQRMLYQEGTFSNEDDDSHDAEMDWSNRGYAQNPRKGTSSDLEMTAIGGQGNAEQIELQKYNDKSQGGIYLDESDDDIEAGNTSSKHAVGMMK